MIDFTRITRVSLSPSKIPYGGFSPVRLQTEIPPQPSSSPSSLSVARIRPATRSYMWRQPRHPDRAAHSRADRRGIGYHRSKRHALHQHKAIPSRGPWLPCGLCCPAGSSLTMASSEPLSPTRRFMFFIAESSRPSAEIGRGPRGSPLYSLFLDLRAALRTPMDRVVAPGCNFTTRSGLRHFRTGSASTSPTHVGSRVGRVTRLQGSLNATARRLARPSPTRAITLKLSPAGIAPHQRRV
jgi:hypothetical protein